MERLQDANTKKHVNAGAGTEERGAKGQSPRKEKAHAKCPHKALTGP